MLPPRVTSNHSILKTYQKLTELLQNNKTHLQKYNVMSLKSSSHFCRWCVFIGHEYMLHIHVIVCDTVQLLAEFPQSNGVELEEAEDFKCVFFVYCVCQNRKKDQL